MSSSQLSRNQRYEISKRSQGLEKITLWIPTSALADFQLAASLCCENRDLVLGNLRSSKTGRAVSLRHAVTGDNGGRS